ncbi:MAG: DUF697 domain-containing protein [Bacteroidota bacterium]
MDKKDTANHIIKKHVLFAMGSSLIPVPVVDIVAVTSIQLDMIKQLAVLYDLDFRGSMGKSTLMALAGNSLSRIGASALKGIPLIGTLIGGVTMSVLAGSSTLAVGEVMTKHFEEGGNFTDFKSSDWREYYEERYEQAKKVVERWKQEQTVKHSPEPREVIDIEIQEDQEEK